LFGVVRPSPETRVSVRFATSSAFGVGSNDEDAGSAVGGADVGRSYSRPFRIEPAAGKVSEDPVASTSKQS
jgi:hypothetical protein